MSYPLSLLRTPQSVYCVPSIIAIFESTVFFVFFFIRRMSLSFVVNVRTSMEKRSVIQDLEIILYDSYACQL